MIAWLPPRPLAVGLLTRGVGCWAGSRLLISLAGVPVAPAGTLICIAVSATIAEIAARRRNLHRLLPNLGVAPSAVWPLHLMPAILGEAALFMLISR